MARFSGKIENLRYADEQHKSIEILYKNVETINSYHIEVDYTNQDFLDLLEEYSIEDIEDQTRIYYENINIRTENAVFDKATEMFESWIKNAQTDLDKQDDERYDIFEKYKEEQLLALQSKTEERYKEVETYKKEQLDILEKEIDEQVESRIAEGFKDVDAYREKQLEVLQSELDTQIQNRYKDVDEYKEQQLEVLEKEMNDQVEGRFKEADAYKEEQLKILQSEIDEQVESRYQEVEGMKKDLLSKFNIETNSTVRYTPEKAVKYIIDNFEDEDTIFKTKLEIFNLPEVKNSKDREMKMKVRKAKTVPEIFAAYHDIQCNHS